MKRKIHWLLILIFSFGLFLRVVNLNIHPASLSWDEVAIGYNAYTIAEQGTDEYGTPFPLLFRSFDDYKLPGYIYLDALFIKLFSFSDFIVRLPSALAGAFLIIVMYFLAKKIFSQRVGLIAALLVAISPWSLQFSRGAFEANVGMFVTTLGITLLFYGIKHKTAAFLSLPVLVASLYCYYSQRLVVPLLVIAFVIFFWKKLQTNRKTYLAGLLIGSILIIPMALQILSPQGVKRMAEVSIANEQAVTVDYLLARDLHSDAFYNFIINRRIPIVFESLHNYFQHFSVGFLFFGEDPNERHRAYTHGLFYLIEIPLLLFGIFLLWKSKRKEEKYFLLFWIIVAPIPAALATETPHGLRALLLLPPLIILLAVAVEYILDKGKKLAIPLAVIYLLLVCNYLIAYYLVYPTKSVSWGYGYQPLYEKLFAKEKDYDQIYITGDQWKPRIYYQYYKKNLSETIAQKGMYETIGKYFFAPSYWDSGKRWDMYAIQKIAKDKKVLVALTDKEYDLIKSIFPLKKIAEIPDYSQRKTVFILVEFTNPTETTSTN